MMILFVMIFVSMMMMVRVMNMILITTCEMKARTVGRCESRFSPGMSVTCDVRRCHVEITKNSLIAQLLDCFNWRRSIVSKRMFDASSCRNLQ